MTDILKKILGSSLYYDGSLNSTVSAGMLCQSLFFAFSVLIGEQLLIVVCLIVVILHQSSGL